MRAQEKEMPESVPALEAEKLSVWMKQDGRSIPAVREFNFSVRKGGCTGIIGESGCGKSLSCQAVLGLLEPKKWEVKGNVRLNGEPVPITDDRKMESFRGRKMALILQNPLAAFDPRMTVGAHFCEEIPVWNRKARKKKLEEAARRLADMEIHDPQRALKSYPFQLSGGMLQRILTALALSRNPELLIADEPTTALDATTQRELLNLLQRHQREQGISLLLISHDLEVISQMADSIVVMYAGEAVECGKAAEILYSPLHPYTRGLFRSVLTYSKERLVCMDGYPPRLEEIPETGCPFAPRCPEREESCSADGTYSERQKLWEAAPGHFVRCCNGKENEKEIAGSKKSQ